MDNAGSQYKEYMQQKRDSETQKQTRQQSQPLPQTTTVSVNGGNYNGYAPQISVSVTNINSIVVSVDSFNNTKNTQCSESVYSFREWIYVQ